jgi:glycerol kinase
VQRGVVVRLAGVVVSGGLLLGIDDGTTAVKVALFDLELRAVAEARRPVPVTHPHPGWVEQDPELILEAVVNAVAEVLEHTRGRKIVAAGLDHQGESTLAWLLAHDDAVGRAREAGTLRMGTVDAFLTDRLGERFATDLSTASRTQLLAVGGRDWDEQLLTAFDISREWLPALGPSFGALGELRHERWPVALPLAAQLVDQQAALAGSGAVRPGELKATYGTGVFVLGRTREPVTASGLLPTVAWAAPSDVDAAGTGEQSGIGEVSHALDGGVFAAGSLLEWLATGLGLAADAPSLAAAAASVPDSAGVMVLPALAGLGAPWWRPDAHGVIAGLHPAVRPAHIARAALEAIAWRVADIVEAAGAVAPIQRVLVDGGLTNSETLLRIQADALGLPLTVGRPDTTVLGAAMLAGVGGGVLASIEEAAARLPQGSVSEPRGDQRERNAQRERWRAFVRASAEL